MGAVGACGLEWSLFGKHMVEPGPAPVDKHVAALGLALVPLEL